jgi:hypothetical protein
VAAAGVAAIIVFGGIPSNVDFFARIPFFLRWTHRFVKPAERATPGFSIPLSFYRRREVGHAP